MRNSVKVLDPSYPRVTIEDLDNGQLFQFIDRKNEDAIYMKVETRDIGFSNNANTYAVHLATGKIFSMNADVLLCRVSLVQIGSGS